MERIAVIIPAHNRLSMLRRAIRSVLEQTRRPDELIVVDDGSTENLSPVRDWLVSEGYSWIRLDRLSGGSSHGPGPARNTGVSATTSEWISFLDSDDEWEPEKLASQVRWHEQNPDIPISQVKEQWFRNGNSVKKPGHLQQFEGDLFEESCRRCAIGPSCTMMHRGLWDEAGGFNPDFRVCEDFELWLRITVRYPVGLLSGDPLSRKYGGHEDQLSVATPLLERFRLLALVQFLREEECRDSQRTTVREAIHHFATQLSQYSEAKSEGEWVPILTEVMRDRVPSETIVRELRAKLLDEPKDCF